MERKAAMPVVDALKVLANARGAEDIVITNQGSARIWPQISQHRNDFAYNPSTMGGAIPLALGLALAQPQRQVIVVSGDGALLMSLGSLVTVVGAGVQNLTVVVLENRLYEVTGGQQTPAANTTNYAAIAHATGFPTAASFSELNDWQSQASSILVSPGPHFINLQVQATPLSYLKSKNQPIREQLLSLAGRIHMRSR